MGRSGGGKKRSLKRESLTRRRNPTGSTSSLQEEDLLILAGSSLWARDPDILLDPKKALAAWIEENPDYDGERNNLEFWQRTKDRFLLSVRECDPGEGPFFRGQNQIFQDVLDRPRSWSKDIDTALSFAKTQPIIKGSGKASKCPSIDAILDGSEDIFLEEGEEVILTLYAAPKASSGIDLNEENKERYKQEIVEKIKRGEVLFLKYKDENGTWQPLSFNCQRLRSYALKRAIKEKGINQTLAALGLGRVSSEKLRDWVFSLDSHRFDSFLKRLKSESIYNEFKKRENEIINQVLSKEMVAEMKYYPNEEEVVLDPKGIERVDKFEVAVLKAGDDIEKIDDREIDRRFQEGLKKIIGG